MIKKLLLAGVLALLGATQADAGFSARQWYEGMFTCKIAGSPDLLEAYITTQQGELTGWGHLTKSPSKPPVDHVQPRGDTVSFYFDSNPRGYVELHRHRLHYGPHRGRYSNILTGKLVMKGKHYDLSCTRR